MRALIATCALSALVSLAVNRWSETVKTYRPWNPEQSYLLPPSPSEWLPQGHLAYFILDVVKEVELSAIKHAVDIKDARGTLPYSPVMMIALLLYAYCVGVFSSRRIERATYEDVAFRVISGGNHPHFTRIAEFRRTHIDAFAAIFEQTVKLCERAGLVKLGLVALDGTKMQGNASKHKAMSYERMESEEKRIKEEIASLLQRAEEADQSEDERYGKGQREEDLPAELRRREGRLEKIRAAKRALEQEALRTRKERLEEMAAEQEQSASTHDDPVERKRAATRAKKHRDEAQTVDDRLDDDEPPSGSTASPSGLDTHRVKAKPDGSPDAKAQYNFTDPDSRIQKSGGAYVQGYNCQAAVDAEAQVIVAQGVTNLQPDNSHLQPMLEQSAATCDRHPAAALADAGYWTCDNAAYGETHDIDLYISTRRHRHGKTIAPDGAGGVDADSDADTADADPRARMRARLVTDGGRALYARRKAIVEPVFGQIKDARGFRRFLLRGMRKVSGEWALLTATHNLLKYFRYASANCLVTAA